MFCSFSFTFPPLFLIFVEVKSFFRFFISVNLKETLRAAWLFPTFMRKLKLLILQKETQCFYLEKDIERDSMHNKHQFSAIRWTRNQNPGRQLYTYSSKMDVFYLMFVFVYAFYEVNDMLIFVLLLVNNKRSRNNENRLTVNRVRCWRIYWQISIISTLNLQVLHIPIN